MKYRIEHKSKIRQTYEIYKVEHGFDVECFITNFDGEIIEMWELDHENGNDIKVDFKTYLSLPLAVVLSDLKFAIEEYEVSRGSYRKLLLGPFRSAK